jgi:hypothetical protein
VQLRKTGGKPGRLEKFFVESARARISRQLSATGALGRLCGLWRKLRTTNAIERCFVEGRRRTRPMVLFTNMQSVERILHAVFYRFNEHGCGE